MSRAPIQREPNITRLGIACFKVVGGGRRYVQIADTHNGVAALLAGSALPRRTRRSQLHAALTGL